MKKIKQFIPLISFLVVIIGLTAYSFYSQPLVVDMISTGDQGGGGGIGNKEVKKKITRAMCIRDVREDCVDRNRKYVANKGCGYCGAVIPKPTLTPIVSNKLCVYKSIVSGTTKQILPGTCLRAPVDNYSEFANYCKIPDGDWVMVDYKTASKEDANYNSGIGKYTYCAIAYPCCNQNGQIYYPKPNF